MTGHVLVVDDEPAIRRVLKLVLELEGFAVTDAANGQEALARAAEQRPDVVLLDLAMPVMDGWHCYERLRAAAPDVPVVFMTAARRVWAEAARYEAAGGLPKPFDVEQVLDTVARFVPSAHA